MTVVSVSDLALEAQYAVTDMLLEADYVPLNPDDPTIGPSALGVDFDFDAETTVTEL